MVTAETEVLRIARNDWRFDNLSALETFARVQHFGGPTRLIDVTKNPYIGAWFAVEFDANTEDDDARLFALATMPVTRKASSRRLTRGCGWTNSVRRVTLTGTQCGQTLIANYSTGEPEPGVECGCPPGVRSENLRAERGIHP